MRLLGHILSKAAQWFLPDACEELERVLLKVHQTYKSSIRPNLSPLFMVALVCAEDRRFFAHAGVDLIAIMRVFSIVLAKRKLMGASTIEQQLVRTLTGRREKRLGRKIREILLATRVCRVIPKHDIPGMYLSVAYFGWSMNGIIQACRRLDVRISSASLRQAASIVARLKYPEPRVALPERIRRIESRTDYVLKLIERRGRDFAPQLQEGFRYETVLD